MVVQTPFTHTVAVEEELPPLELELALTDDELEPLVLELETDPDTPGDEPLPVNTTVLLELLRLAGKLPLMLIPFA